MVGAIPTPYRLEMRNVRGGSHTTVDFEDVQYDSGIDDSMFAEHRLEKGI